MEVTEKGGIDALIKVLVMAEHFEQWRLYKAVLRYVRDAGGHVIRTGTKEYLIQIDHSPKEQDDNVQAA